MNSRTNFCFLDTLAIVAEKGEMLMGVLRALGLWDWFLLNRNSFVVFEDV